MTVKELLERMDSRELCEWMAFYDIAPFGEERADIRQAITSCTIANAWSKQKHKVKDFIPTFTKPQEKGKRQRQTTEEMKKLLMSVATPAKQKKEKVSNGNTYANS